MGNIIGDPFDDFVKRQIETRQKALGQSSNISSDVLKYYTVFNFLFLHINLIYLFVKTIN